MKLTDLTRPALTDLPKVCDPRGNLSFIQNGDQVPFDIARCYWIYDVPGGRSRDAHAFYTQRQLIVALSGSFDVVVTSPDGTVTRHHLARSYYGLYLPPLTWRELDNFSTNSVAMILSSTLYDEDDYINDFELYKTIADGNPE